jgi:hypothetical protein
MSELDLRNFSSDDAHHIWAVATQNGQLTAGRLVITVVPTAGGKLGQ